MSSAVGGEILHNAEYVCVCGWIMSGCMRVGACVCLYCALRDSWGSSSAGRLLPPVLLPPLGTDLSAGEWHFSSAVGGEILHNAELSECVWLDHECVACVCARVCGWR